MFSAVLASALLAVETSVLGPPSATENNTAWVLSTHDASFMEAFQRTNALFWDGIDVLDTEKAKENEYRFGRIETAHLFPRPSNSSRHPLHRKAPIEEVPSVKPKVNLEVMGLQDTGTNLLTSLLNKNFGSQITLLDAAFGGDRHGVWKHSNMGFIDLKRPELFDNLKKQNAVPVVVVRDPLSWLQSIKKAPYELNNCVQGTNWLSKPCMHRVPAGYAKPLVGPAYFHFLSGLWGNWTESYSVALGKNFRKTVILRYEDLVLRTEDTLRSLANVLGLEMPPEVMVVESPAKNHGEALGRVAAIDKIEKELFLDQYTDKELSMVCGQLMNWRDALTDFHYTKCIHVRRNSTVYFAAKKHAIDGIRLRRRRAGDVTVVSAVNNHHHWDHLNRRKHS